MRVWAVANQKGGVGKTTSTVNIGGILAKEGKRVLMIDLDPHGSLTAYMGLDPESIEHSVYDVFQQFASGKVPDVSQVIRSTEFDNLYVMPSSTAVATLEKQFGSRSGMGLVLHQVLERAAADFDYAFIDCPPMLGMLMINALAASKRVIIPVQTEHLAIKGMERMLRTLTMVQKSLSKDMAYTILPTMYDQRTLACKQSLQRLVNEHKQRMTNVVIPVDTRLRDASHKGVPISWLPGESGGQNAYEQFVKKLSGMNKPASEVA